MHETVARPSADATRRLAWSGLWLGFGLGMFFDGILLHQILQWHHLLSGVLPDETAAELRVQVLADGAFHLVTYALTALGLWLLWTGRGAIGHPVADQRLLAFGVMGFGIWHVVDAVLVHWILQLHRIRMDVPNPLVWDIGWLVPFGIVPVVLGLVLLRREPPASPPGGGRGRVVAPVLLAVGTLGPLSLLPPEGVPDDRALVVFRPGMGLPEVAAATAQIGGHPVWSDAAGGVWLVAFEPGTRASALYRHGALMVSTGPVALGCLSWSEIAAAGQPPAAG